MRDREYEKKIIADATAGPWEVVPDFRPAIVQKGYSGYRSDLSGYCGSGCLTSFDKYDNNMNDAEFIAEARTGWPEDLAWRERAESVLRKIEQASLEYMNVCPNCGVYPTARVIEYEGEVFNDDYYDHAKTCELKALIGEGKQ